MRILGLFWASFVSIGGVIAAFVGLQQVNLTWAFWLALPLALVATAGIWYASHGVEAVRRIREFPGLEAKVVELEQSRRADERRVDELTAQIAAARENGVAEGQRQVIGSLLASDVDPPEPRAVVEYEGTVAFACSVTAGEYAPPMGARFFVQSPTSGNVRGVVEACYVDGDRDVLYLKCVEPSVPKFWKALAEKVEYDESLPSDVELRPYMYTPSQSESQPLAVGSADPDREES